MNKNNFDFLRLMFALFVIISHSYPLSGVPENDWLSQLTNQSSFSDIGVKGFFVISGFLIFQSLQRSKSIIDYFWKRFLRLFPGLFVVLMLTIILAPFVYQNGTVSYLSNKDVWKYVPYNMSLYKLRYYIHGVFENNPHTSAINGSLWTIAYEFTCYIAIASLFFVRKKETFVKAILSGVFLLLLIGNLFFPKNLSGHLHFYDLDSQYIFSICIFFAAGSILAAFNILHKGNLKFIFWSSFSLLIISFALHIFQYTTYFLLPVAIISFGLMSTKYLNQIGEKIGDMSYGVYIYAYPIQQTLVHFFKFNYWQLMLATIPVTLFFAFFSWHLIEKRALQFKKMKLSALKLF